MTINQAAAVSAGRVESNIQMAVMLKVREQMDQREQAVATLIESALENAQQIQSIEAGKGEHVELQA